MLLGKEVKSIQSLGLSFSNRRNIRRSREAPVTRVATTSVLDDQTLRVLLGRGLVVQKRTQLEPLSNLAEPRLTVIICSLE
jgi:hypothetical protein